MFKYVMVLVVLAQMSQAQKSFYAGSQQSYYPKVLAKYKTTTTTTTTPDSLVNRVDEESASVRPDVTSPFSVYPEQESDYDKFIQRVSSWPEDKQPFWYKNRQAISAMINQGVDGGNGQQPSGNSLGTNVRSPFAGRRGRSFFPN